MPAGGDQFYSQAAALVQRENPFLCCVRSSSDVTAVLGDHLMSLTICPSKKKKKKKGQGKMWV